MTALEPVAGVADHILAHSGAVRAVIVDRIAPRGAVLVGEVGAQAPQVVAFGTKVVVDHVHDHRQPLAVAGIDQPLQALDPAVGILCRVGINTVIAPVALAGELRDRQQFQRIDS